MKVVGLHGVENIKEVVSRWSFTRWKDVREVLGDLGVIGELWPQGLDGELIIMRHFDENHLILLQQLLLSSKDLLQEVLVDVDLRW